jgi:hypothetical protein
MCKRDPPRVSVRVGWKFTLSAEKISHPDAGRYIIKNRSDELIAASSSQRILTMQRAREPRTRQTADFVTRRALFGVPALIAATATSAAPAPTNGRENSGGAEQRAQDCFQLRMKAALAERQNSQPDQTTNGDESLYPNRMGNYSKGLAHNSIGEVDRAGYESLLAALSSGAPEDFEKILLGGNVRLVNPQAGMAFDMEGADSHQLAIGTPPALASAQRAGEAVEDYWMALLRDVAFSAYETDPAARAACAELSRLKDFRGPKQNGLVTPATLFRGFTHGDSAGPYVSQFLLKPLGYGAIRIEQKLNTYLALNNGGTDYMTDTASWLAVRNGAGPFGSNRIDPMPRYARNGRDLAAYVHVDVLFEAYFNACLWLIDNGAPLNPGNPYNSSATQDGFGTFGAPHVKTMVAEAATRALKAVWYQKWFVHRCLRPEEFGGLVHFTRTGAAAYPLHPDVLHSEAVDRVFQRNGTYLLPHAFPEGCPQHPSYGEGHGTVAGACATMVKAFFDDAVAMSSLTDIVQASPDGLSLMPYAGSDSNQLTVGGEMNKLAANIALGRDHAAVHWRSDYADAVRLGESVAISILRDQKATYNESFQGFTFTKFDGARITV